jgi:hypothetical protein
LNTQANTAVHVTQDLKTSELEELFDVKYILASNPLIGKVTNAKIEKNEYKRSIIKAE